MANILGTVTKATTVDVVLLRTVDYPAQREVHAFTTAAPDEPLVLWTGDAYDTAGDWTQAMAESRVKALLGL